VAYRRSGLEKGWAKPSVRAAFGEGTERCAESGEARRVIGCQPREGIRTRGSFCERSSIGDKETTKTPRLGRAVRTIGSSCHRMSRPQETHCRRVGRWDLLV
jgi:hypothetical protein